jgi:hypothetical protein
MLMGASDAIRIEDPSVEKAEFIVFKGSQQEFHQAKGSNPSGKWSVAALANKVTTLIQAVGGLLSGNRRVRATVSRSRRHRPA